MKAEVFASSSFSLGAYALTASLPTFSADEARFFYQSLAEFPLLDGLELPLHCEAKADDPWRDLSLLPRHWFYWISPLPFVMQRKAKDPHYGLASPREASRQQALQDYDAHRLALFRLQDALGHRGVKGFWLHSAPYAEGEKTASAFRRSLDVILCWDWAGVPLVLEHCDAAQEGWQPRKGFLPLATEIDLALEYQLPLGLNWGRSVVEGRSVSAAAQHLAEVLARTKLGFYMFSGVAVADPLYGDWEDNHAGFLETTHAYPWSASRSLLTGAELQASCARLPHDIPMLGVKTQAFPPSLSLDQRLDFARWHWQAFLQANGSQC